MTQQVTLALELPVEAESVLDECSIEVQKPKGEPNAPGSALHFDPLTGAAVGWVFLKVTGDTASLVAGHLIADFVVKRLKGDKKIIPVRFPDGTIFELRIDDDASIRDLENKIAEKAQP